MQRKHVANRLALEKNREDGKGTTRCMRICDGNLQIGLDGGIVHVFLPIIDMRLHTGVFLITLTRDSSLTRLTFRVALSR